MISLTPNEAAEGQSVIATLKHTDATLPSSVSYGFLFGAVIVSCDQVDVSDGLIYCTLRVPAKNDCIIPLRDEGSAGRAPKVEVMAFYKNSIDSASSINSQSFTFKDGGSKCR